MTIATRTQPHAFTVLLAQYISGDVAEDQLSSICTLVETAEASAAERLAFARYYLDARKEDAAVIPKVEEWSEIARAARA